MKIINLFGSPGAGKSTGAAYVFAQLKMRGISCELVTEFAKDKVYEETKEVWNNQAYIFGKQYFRVSRVTNKVDVIVTDAPLLLSLLYNKDDLLGEPFNTVVKNVFDSFENMNYFVKRVKEYNPQGRFQTEEEANQLSYELAGILTNMEVDYTMIKGNFEGYDTIVEDILKNL